MFFIYLIYVWWTDLNYLMSHCTFDHASGSQHIRILSKSWKLECYLTQTQRQDRKVKYMNMYKTQYLVQAGFAWIPGAMGCGGDESVALLKDYGSPDSSDFDTVVRAKSGWMMSAWSWPAEWGTKFSIIWYMAALTLDLIKQRAPHSDDVAPKHDFLGKPGALSIPTLPFWLWDLDFFDAWDFGSLSKSSVLLGFSWGSNRLKLLLLDTREPVVVHLLDASVHGGSWSSDYSGACEYMTYSWMGFMSQYSQDCVLIFFSFHVPVSSVDCLYFHMELEAALRTAASLAVTFGVWLAFCRLAEPTKPDSDC